MITLYKRNVDGSTQQWTVEVKENLYRTISGRKDGKLITSAWTACKGKNIGKANETSDCDQAVKEMLALTEKKRDKGYGDRHEDLDSHGIIKPMLAAKYSDPLRHKEVLDALSKVQVYVQPKLDGVRCIATKDGLMSRQWKPLVSTPHIGRALKPFFDANPEAILDGELYTHKFRDDFDQIISLARQTKPSAEDLRKSEELLEYHVYDMISDECFSERRLALDNCGIWGKSVKHVTTQLVISEEEMDAVYGEYLSEGYEGQMIRVNGPYECGTRSKYLLKRKEFVDEEFTIKDVKEGKGNYSGCAVLTVVTEAGVEVDASIKCGVEKKKQLFADRQHLIGEQVTVRFQGKTKDGSLRFPVAVAIRGQL